MNDEPLPERSVLELAEGLALISSDAADAFGGEPTLGELLEIIGWAFPDGSDAIDGSFAMPLRFKVGMKANKRYAFPAASRVGELGDAVFADTTDLLNDLLAQLDRASQGPVSRGVFSSALLGILRTGRVPLADVAEAGDIRTLTIDAPKSAVRLSVGDVLAIPAASGGHRVAVVLARNGFGTALGLLRGVNRLPRTASAHVVPKPYPVYTDEQLVKSGVWKVIGHDESLLGLFPAEPEIYHKPRRRPGVDDTGEFGAAETADGRLRFIGSEEARNVGLADGSYRQTVLGEFLQRQLDESGD
jgi:hypothetical protein